LLEGYRRKGIVYVWIFLLFNLLTGTINLAGVSMLSGALLAGYGITSLSIQSLTIMLMVVCGGMVLVGRYRLLDSMAKIIISILALATIAAVLFAAGHQPEPVPGFVAPSPYQWASFAFLISLLGWMPAPIDLSAWSSLWMFSRRQQTGHLATVRESAIDFYLGYSSAVVLAVLFLALGAMVMFGTGESFSNSGTAFSAQLVNLYTATIGEWSRMLILSAAFITMFSTTLTVIDGYPRSFAACCVLIGFVPEKRFTHTRQIWIVVSVVCASIVVSVFVTSLLQLLTFAAIISFLTSPVLAYINLKVMEGQNVPEAYRPGMVLKIISWAGLAFFAVMAVGFVISLLRA
jgi:Mn2+/Fe2+ NRAMP family transporter